MQDRKGGCLCGAVRYVLKGEPRAIAICHCTHCQRQSGSLFSFNLVIRKADYEQSGETMVYVDKGDSGQPVYRHFCGRCGSPILATIADHAVKWLAPVAGAARFAQNQRPWGSVANAAAVVIVPVMLSKAPPQ